jgi:hypothetical protein
VEWLSANARARKQALREENILSAYRTAGLFPFCPPKVYGLLTSLVESQTLHPRQTPESDTSPLEHPLLASSPADMNVFRATNECLKDRIATNPSISPEERAHIDRLTRSTEKFFARNNIRRKTSPSVLLSMHEKIEPQGKEGFLRVSIALPRRAFTLSLRNIRERQRRRQRRQKRRQKRGSAKARVKSTHHPTQQLIPHSQYARTWKYWTTRRMRSNRSEVGGFVIEYSRVKLLIDFPLPRFCLCLGFPTFYILRVLAPLS